MKVLKKWFVCFFVIFCVFWSLKIVRNQKQYVYEIHKYEPGETMQFNGIEIATEEARLYGVAEFLNRYGQQYAADYDDETLRLMNGTKVLTYTFRIKNISEQEYDLKELFGAYVRMEHRWISAFNPLISQDINPIFNRAVHTGNLQPGEEIDLTFVTDINHIAITDNTWQHLTDYGYTLCLGSYQEGYCANELNFKIEETVTDD